MANLISLEDAARFLGISVEALNELVVRKEIFPVKTGAHFKFKQDELDRYKSNLGGGEDLSSEFDLADDDELQLASEGGSDVLAATESKSADSPSDTGKMGEEEDLLLADDDLFSDGELSLADGSSIVDSDSDLEDSDLVLDDDSSSEVGLASAGSGISLSPSDSGLSLDEEPAVLADSDLDALSLPDDDSLVGMDDLGSDVRADDEFLLTPVEESSEDETSGSQIIALDDSEIYPDDSASGLLAQSASGDEAAPALDAESADLFQGVGAGAGMVAAAPVAGSVVYEPAEASYTIFQVLSLMMVFTILALSMVLTIDVARNVWNQNESNQIAAPVADILIQMVGLKKD